MEKVCYGIRSKCCNSKVKVVMSPDFFGDNPNTQKIGTGYYVCLKCHKACDVIFIERKFWKRNPHTIIQKDKRKKIQNKIINKEIEQIGNA